MAILTVMKIKPKTPKKQVRDSSFYKQNLAFLEKT